MYTDKSLFFLLFALLFLFACNSEDNLSNADDARLNSSEGFLNDLNGGSVPPDFSGEGYNTIEENPWVNTQDEPVSTFSIDADGGSYSNTRRFLHADQLPPKDAIRTEEYINYFPMDYAGTSSNVPIALNGEISKCPWDVSHSLLRIGIKGKDLEELPPSNFVFLIDVSGSMGKPDKLALLQDAFKIFADNMTAQDKIAMVTYAGTAGVVLPATNGDKKSEIHAAIDQLSSGGSTAGAQGIITAYEIAEQNFIEGGNNRVVLGTDGDFNVGVSSQEGLIELIEEKRKSGVFLTVLGVGTGNYQDGKMEQLANNGNGTYEYLDNLEQAEKVLIHELQKFYTVAKDVKVQIDFNPNIITSYRLIGYENRVLENQDFEDDEKDAGEIGAGQTITALYELVLNPVLDFTSPAIEVDFRYKLPDQDVSQPVSLTVKNEGLSFDDASENMRFSAAVASFGLLLRDSEYKGNTSFDDIVQWAEGASDYDPHEYRSAFIELVKKAKSL